MLLLAKDGSYQLPIEGNALVDVKFKTAKQDGDQTVHWSVSQDLYPLEVYLTLQCSCLRSCQIFGTALLASRYAVRVPH